MSRVWVGAILLITFQVWAVPPPCKKGEPPEWCSPEMVAMKYLGPGGSSDIRLGNGTDVFWQAEGWKGSLVLNAQRLSDGQLRVKVSRSEGGSSVVTRTLRKGAALILTAGKEVPNGFFGAQTTATFVDDD
jgi:hypothetical protein